MGIPINTTATDTTITIDTIDTDALLHRYWQAVCLPESCPKNGDLPKSPLSQLAVLVPSDGTILV